MEFRILGSVQIHDDRSGVGIMPAGAKQRALLGALIVKAGQEVSADRLVDELWGDRLPANAANALQAHVARLRRLLQAVPGDSCARHGWLVTRPMGYVLRTDCASTDAQRFQRLVTEGRELAAVDPGRSAQVLRSALALWRGRALEGSARGSICAAEAAMLEEHRMVALEMLYDACLRAGQYREITVELKELTATHPLRERFYELLMIALYRCGRQAEALGTYERARRRLASDLGVEPGPALRGCMETVSQHEDPGVIRNARPGAACVPVVRLAEPPEWPAPGRAAGAPPEQGERSDGELSVHLLRGEVALLRRRIERLSREQQDLLSRIERLTGA
ncbi:AfsR/SARP family transcriptional regulator [Streptomyces hyaluromycini]|uniref:AfsR/SARP family transcriptional regulator n=1 Tax=Streptomyces hyaluromycini TaxID=1377993 RepID=UPI000B5CED8B|nr:AfsR/SARP family transcriptional regulator [Streptomyces hyaluromycini]